MSQPSREDIAEAIDVIEKLCNFEGSMRLLRGYGAFLKEDLPSRPLVNVLEWLRELAGVEKVAETPNTSIL